MCGGIAQGKERLELFEAFLGLLALHALRLVDDQDWICLCNDVNGLAAAKGIELFINNALVLAGIERLHIPEKWSGRADAIGNAGTFQCGIHHQHLRSLNVRHETERSRHDWKHPPKRDLTPKPKRRLQLAAAVQTFKIFLKTEKLVLFCQINLNKSTAFLRQIRPFSQ